MEILPARGAFATTAHDLHEHRLIVLPASGDKTPLVRGFTRWRGQSKAAIDRLIAKHGDANIATLTGRRHTVVDVDDENTLADAEQRFGRTPLVIRTPRGGGHLVYRASGERSANLRRYGLKIDIKGVGGYVLTPPSRKTNGGVYRIERGSWDDLDQLPEIAPGSIPGALPPPPVGRSRPAPLERAGGVSEGSRNTWLFSELREHALTCQTYADLATWGRILNTSCTPPLPDADVQRTVQSVWRYKVDGTLMVNGRQTLIMPVTDLDLVAGDGDACLMWLTLRRHHGARVRRGEPFAASCKAMAKANVIPTWTPRRYRMALHALVAVGLVVRVHTGGSEPGDPHLFTFGMGSIFEPNVMNTPLAAFQGGAA